MAPLKVTLSILSFHNLRVTTFVMVESHSSTSVAISQSQLVQSAKARKCKDEEIIELPPVTCNIDAPTFTRLNLVMHEVLPTLWSSISTLKKPNPMALIVGVFGTPALEVADQFHMLKYVFVSSTWSHVVILYLLLTSAWQRNSTTTTTIPGFQRTNKNMRDLLGVLGLWAWELCWWCL